MFMPVLGAGDLSSAREALIDVRDER